MTATARSRTSPSGRDIAWSRRTRGGGGSPWCQRPRGRCRSALTPPKGAAGSDTSPRFSPDHAGLDRLPRRSPRARSRVNTYAISPCSGVGLRDDLALVTGTMVAPPDRRSPAEDRRVGRDAVEHRRRDRSPAVRTRGSGHDARSRRARGAHQTLPPCRACLPISGRACVCGSSPCPSFNDDIARARRRELVRDRLLDGSAVRRRAGLAVAWRIFAIIAPLDRGVEIRVGKTRNGALPPSSIEHLDDARFAARRAAGVRPRSSR